MPWLFAEGTKDLFSTATVEVSTYGSLMHMVDIGLSYVFSTNPKQKSASVEANALKNAASDCRQTNSRKDKTVPPYPNLLDSAFLPKSKIGT